MSKRSLFVLYLLTFFSSSLAGQSVFELVGDLTKVQCPPTATHLFTTYKPAELPYKTTEHYCVLPSGKRTGDTIIAFIDYTGATASTYTVGQYANGERQGQWVIIDVTGAVISECFYVQGKLLDGDPAWCPSG